MKAVVGTFNQEKALVGAFSVIAKTLLFADGSFAAQVKIEERTLSRAGYQVTFAARIKLKYS